MRSFTATAAVLCLVGCGVAVTSAGRLYNPTPLRTLGETWSEAKGINANGQIVGRAHTSQDAADHAFLNDIAMRDLNSLLAPDSGLTITDAWAPASRGLGGLDWSGLGHVAILASPTGLRPLSGCCQSESAPRTCGRGLWTLTAKENGYALHN